MAVIDNVSCDEFIWRRVIWLPRECGEEIYILDEYGYRVEERIESIAMD